MVKDKILSQNITAKSPMNILFINIEGLRNDMLNPANMPFLYKFASERGFILKKHYTTGNNTPGSLFGMLATALVLAAITLLGAWSAARLWPAPDPDVLAHAHPDLPERHPHFATSAGGRHVHAFVIDDLHRRWPSDT